MVKIHSSCKSNQIYLSCRLCSKVLMILTEQKSSEVADRLRQAVEAALVARNLSARRASIDVVGHDGLIRDIRAGRIPSVDRVEALFNYLGLEAYFGPKRSVSPPDFIANHSPGETAPVGFLTIPWAEAGSRPGSAPVAFSRSWLDAHDLVPDFLQAAQPDLVNLEGPKAEDAIALLDTRVALRNGHGAWCFRAKSEVVVSRVTFKGSITVVHPAKPEDAPQIIEGRADVSMTILGKVVWLGQSIPLKGTVT